MDGPYREPKPLRELIAPDRRRERALVLFAGGIILGGLVVHFGPGLFARYPTEIGPVPAPPAPIPVVVDDRPPFALPTASPPTVETSEVQSVVAQHRASVRRACWDGATRRSNAAGAVVVTIEVAPSGDVASAESEGDDALVASCVESQVRSWKFPAHTQRSGPIVLPFQFSVAESP